MPRSDHVDEACRTIAFASRASSLPANASATEHPREAVVIGWLELSESDHERVRVKAFT
jgi:hypothetical protein